jgi:uncharacterized protein (TIGR00251 family)
MSHLLKIRVIPRAKKNEIVEKLPDGSLKIKIKAQPVDGKANSALVEFLSEELCVAKSQIKIVKGEKGRNKVVELF